ncbi:alpha/beta hydrolase fold-3 domain containing protein [Cordyceps militaris CM01]|uniref:Alpha/beta hydrolase fold-3 domain containing protein n=1 Tax=Cordyceps militaris (strain CM01) TaxID=983644 RepID=G3JET9_CORMM|nr:alpha/beta hydrolase fold-3 domain containing protein [Cordyceps militaris CM01]EGX93048.1 alpha/beta hydrolase fold-3 domain containing protein [Cordyceps militaris CM01]
MAAIKRHPLLSYQPLRLFFQVYVSVTILLRLPYYVVTSLFPRLRANPKWNAKQNFMTRMAKPVLGVISRVGITEKLALTPGKEGRRFELVPVPTTTKIYQGPLLLNQVQPAQVGGTWYPDIPASHSISGNVVLYLHGGAFVQGDGRTSTCAKIADYFLTKGTADLVFSLQYRLSGYGGLNPFPAALQDAVAAYVFLIRERKISPRQIIISGDSAGGNLAAALIRYLNDYGSAIDLPLPKCAVLFSPWVNPFEHETEGNPQRDTDFVPGTYGAWGSSAYAGAHANPSESPYMAQLGHPYLTPVPWFVNVGTDEVLFRQIEKWTNEMRSVQGNKMEVNYEQHAVHDTYFVGHLFGFEESAWAVASKVADFVESLPSPE